MKTRGVVFSLVCIISMQVFAVQSSTHFATGITAFEQKKFDEAIKYFQKEVQLTPTNISALYNLAKSFEEMNQKGSAILYYEKVLKLKPNDREALNRIEVLQLDLHPDREWTAVLGHFKTALYSIDQIIWLGLSVLLSCSIFLCVYLRLRSQSRQSRKLITGILVLISILFILTVKAVHSIKTFRTSHAYAIVLKKQIQIFSEKGIATEKHLTEGERIEILRVLPNGMIKSKSFDGLLIHVKKEDVGII